MTNIKIEKKPIDLNGIAKFIDENLEFEYGLKEKFIVSCLFADERGDAELLSVIFKNKKIFNLSDRHWYNYLNGVWIKDELHSCRYESYNILKNIYNSYLKFLKKNVEEFKTKGKSEALDFCSKTIDVVKQKLSKLNKKSKMDNIIDLLAKDYHTCKSNQFDKDIYLINLKNGVYDLENYKLLPHNPAFLMKKQAGVNYDPKIHPEQWLIFLNQIFNNDNELIRLLQQLLGIWLTGSADFQYLVFAYGSGANGKSTLFTIIQWFLNGKDRLNNNAPASNAYFSKFDIQALLTNKYNKNVADQNLANLQGVRLAVASELPYKSQLNEGLIKDITGSEAINARFLYGDAFTFYPTHKMVIFGNHKPIVKDVSEGFWRRVILFPFEVTIPEKDRKPMSLILNEMKNEFSGIFNWAIDGLKDYRINGLFIPNSVKVATEEYRNENNQLLQYFEDRKDTYKFDKYNQGLKIVLKDLFEDYEKWVFEDEQNRTKVFANTRSFSNAVRALGYNTKKLTNNKSFALGIQKLGGLYD